MGIKDAAAATVDNFVIVVNFYCTLTIRQTRTHTHTRIQSLDGIENFQWMYRVWTMLCFIQRLHTKTEISNENMFYEYQKNTHFWEICQNINNNYNTFKHSFTPLFWFLTVTQCQRQVFFFPTMSTFVRYIHVCMWVHMIVRVKAMFVRVCVTSFHS